MHEDNRSNMTKGLAGLLGLAAALSLQVACGPVDGAPEEGGAGSAAQAIRGLLPDLTVEELSRDSGSFKAKYCNRSSYNSSSTFTLRMTNDDTGVFFQSNPLYPYSVPAPGTCAWTGGFSCNLLGVDCDDFIRLTAFVDDMDLVGEMNESNNTMSVIFRQDIVLPDLTVEEIVRTPTAYVVRYCNQGIGGSRATFALRLRNVGTGQTYQTPEDFAVPAVGTCTWSPRMECARIGSNCADTLDVQATVDPTARVEEMGELNNDRTSSFTPSYALADLVVTDIWRQDSTYVVSYCNIGQGTSTSRFQVMLMNIWTGWSFQTPAYAPLPVPAPGQCAQAVSPTCSVPGCWADTFHAVVDVNGAVYESSEGNNTLSKYVP